MHDHLSGLLADEGVTLDGIYYCPHHVDGIVPALAVACDCRKPRPGLLVRAAREFDVELRRSWFIGDILDDVEAGNRAGCRTVLVDLGTEAPPANQLRRPTFVARDTAHALDIVAAEHGVGAPVCLTHLPAGWRSSPANVALVQVGDER
jgi:D-glycero-D-manno-heptose 1,7-bisphosphate phosphatase